MNNRIRTIRIDNHRLDPVDAELWISIEPEQLTPATEVRGRVVGPRCRFSTTVEVAHPLLPLAHQAGRIAGPRRRAAIPEACLWDPQSPFLYEVRVELWEDGLLCETVQISHGLRTMRLGQGGVRVNARLLPLQAVECPELTEARGMVLRQRGIGMLVVPIESAHAWKLADELGFLLIGRLSDLSPETLEQVQALSPHASCFAWLVRAEHLAGSHLFGEPACRQILGVEGTEACQGPFPAAIAFSAGREGASAPDGLPRLVLLNVDSPATI